MSDTTKHRDNESRDEFYRRLKPEGKRLILSIDGGGTKGLMTLHCLVKLEETLFAVNAGPGAKPFEEMPLVDAILASSVAPIFLEPFRVWVDGGVGSFGNPCYVATVEATEYFTGLLPNLSPESLRKRYVPRDDDKAYHHENVIHFSFGTGSRANNVRDEGVVKDMSFFDWLLYVISEGQDDVNNDQVRLTEARFSRGNNWYTDQYHHKRVDFRRYQLFQDPETLAKPVAEGGLGMALSKEEQDLILGLELNANSDEELAIMEKLGKAWADAIGEGFARPHSPYDQTPDAYTPPASPPRKVQPDLEEYLAGIYPSDRGRV